MTKTSAATLWFWPCGINSVDCLTVAEAGRLGLTDEQQLLFAAEHNRLLFSGNARDFARLHVEWLAAGRSHCGIILIARRRRPIGPQIRGILRFLKEHGADECRDTLAYVAPVEDATR